MYIYGKNVAVEKIKSNQRINKIYLTKNFKDIEIMNLIKNKKIKYSFVDNKFINDKVSGNHQGILLDVDDVETFDISYLDNIKSKFPLLVMLDHIEDPHNFGAIIRTSEALGVDAIIIPNDRSVNINATVVKTSAGAIYNMPIIRVANLTSAINKLKNNGYWIVGSDMDGIEYTNVDYKIPICLVIGNEGHGMSKVVSNNCDYIVKIPMIGNINSLNASVSCGILLAQIVNSRR